MLSARVDAPRVATPSNGQWLAIAGLTAGAVLLTAAFVDVAERGTVWAFGFRLLTALAGTWMGYVGWSRAVGRRESLVRGTILLALLIWLASEMTRLVSVLGGDGLQPALGISIGALAVAAAACYVCAAHGRLRPSDEAALYLDAATIFAATSAVMLVLGQGWTTDARQVQLLSYAAFFLALLGATAILDLATLAPRRLDGAYGVLLGILLGGVGYLAQLVVDQASQAMPVAHAVVGCAALLVGYGGGNWTAVQDRSRRYVAVADVLRGWLPIVAVALTPFLVVALVMHVDTTIRPVRIGAAAAIALVVVLAVIRQTVLLRDREQAVRRERTLRSELSSTEALYRSVVERVPGVVYVAEAGASGRWHFVSRKIQEMLGFTPEEWMADPDLWHKRLHPDDRERVLKAEETARDDAYSRSRWEYRLIGRDDRVVWVLDDEEVIARHEDGRPATMQGILLDISERKKLEEQLRHQALHDPLTGLPNRTLFVDRVRHALTRRRGTAGVAVLFMDVDDFKTINDSLGHAAGDDLLIRVAERLTAVLRAEDTACRLGGDEFAVLLEDVSVEQAMAAGQRLLDTLRPPFSAVGREVVVRASIGVAARSGVHDRAEDLLRDADTAMYAAKSLGKGRIEAFASGMEQPVRRRLAMRTALEVALERGELFLEYQPIVHMGDGEVIGVEALVRWNHPQLGRAMPADFVPLAEEMGLIGRLGEWVLRTACRDAAGFAPAPPGENPPIVSVNVSAHQLGGGFLARQVAQVLTETGLDPGRLMLELTESTLAAAGQGIELELAAIDRLGVRIALDDFGSGYSSLEYLGRLPIAVLKIDRSLVSRIDVERQRQEVLRAIGTVAADLGLTTVVEGVEREEQRQALLRLGFDHAQGYLFSPPVPLAMALTARHTAAA